MAPQRIGLIGTGAQARSYGAHIAANPRQFTFAAVASKSQDRMNSYADEFGVPAGARYASAEALVNSGVPLDGLIITSPDTTHEEVTLAAVELGIPILLEKPIADSVEGAYRVEQAAKSAGAHITVGLVLRYTPFYAKIKELIDDGAVGRLTQIDGRLVLKYTFASTHFMRSHNRHRSDMGSFALSMCGHDFDIINWYVGDRATRVASFGGLDYFLPREDAAERCSECDRAAICPFYGPHAFADRPPSEYSDTCVYHIDKDIVDSQHFMIEYANRVRVSFSALFLGNRTRRELMIVGDEGELRADLDRNEIEVDRFRPEQSWRFDLRAASSDPLGIPGLMHDFRERIAGIDGESTATAEAGRESVVVGIGGDEAQRAARIVDLDGLRATGAAAL